MHVRAGGYIEQSLVRLSVLQHNLCLAFDRQDNRLSRFSELLHELTWIPAEGGHRMNVLGDVKHTKSFTG